jgi:hypothetical protein
MDSGAVMFVKGKVPLLPKPIKGRHDIKHLFQETTVSQPADQARDR